MYEIFTLFFDARILQLKKSAKSDQGTTPFCLESIRLKCSFSIS